VFHTYDPQVRAVVDEEKSNVEYCKEESGSSSLTWKANIGDVERILKELGHKIVSYLQVKVRTSTGFLNFKNAPQMRCRHYHFSCALGENIFEHENLLEIHLLNFFAAPVVFYWFTS
jgi:hypothetical protein